MFLAVEGPNGVGKTAVASLLAVHLQDRTGIPVRLTGEPTDTPLGRLLRASESVLRGRALALALAADRAAHIETDIIPALDAGHHVVTDRYVQSSLVLQQVDGLDTQEIWAYNRYVLPATSLYLEDDPDVIARRLSHRRHLTRLERTGSPQRELALYRQAFGFLRRQDWPQHRIRCQGKDELHVVAEILDRHLLTTAGCATCSP
jgi:dTMP kinase